MKRPLFRFVLSIAVLGCLLYSGDYGLLRYRSAQARGAFGTVRVYRYYAIERKANKVEYAFLDRQDQTCVHSLFPHLGYAPCWYLQRHTERKIDI